MPARDIYHAAVRAALVKDGWTVTHDPLRLAWGGRDLFVDLGAERLLAAERQGESVAVEIKSFVGASDVAELELAVGQFVVYRTVLSELDPERVLFLAVPERVWATVFAEPLGQLLRQHNDLHLLVFDPVLEEVRQWMP